ncbi:hypothetical protein [Agathobaculum sp.]|uniref:hypothetical protein n=1 Tax=Agathobaculum sp. TaxID=2048138 RepID=UPI003AB38D8E
MDIRPARFGFRRAGLVHKNSPAWKTEMKSTWEYIFENPERRVFMQGTEQMKKRMAEMIWLQYFNEKLFEQKKIDETARNKLRLAILADGRKA